MTDRAPVKWTVPRPPPEVGPADLTRAVQSLNPDTSGLAAIAKLLGLTTVTPAIPVLAATVEPSLTEPATPSPLSRPAHDGRASVPAAVASDAPALQTTVTPLPGAMLPPTPPAARTLAQLLPPSLPPPPIQGLFTSARRRALLGRIGATQRPEGDVDVEAAVTQLAHGEPLLEVPRHRIPTTKAGLHLLLDVGITMDPYRADIERLPAELTRVVGPDGLELRWFEESPLAQKGVLLPERLEPEPYRLPAAGTPVLAVTVFGARGLMPPRPRVLHEWRQFTEAASRARTPLVVLTPLAPRRQPAGLPPNLAIVTWDRDTSVRSVAHLLRAPAGG
jgi:hypothetical protein